MAGNNHSKVCATENENHIEKDIKCVDHDVVRRENNSALLDIDEHYFDEGNFEIVIKPIKINRLNKSNTQTNSTNKNHSEKKRKHNSHIDHMVRQQNSTYSEKHILNTQRRMSLDLYEHDYNKERSVHVLETRKQYTNPAKYLHVYYSHTDTRLTVKCEQSSNKEDTFEDLSDYVTEVKEPTENLVYERNNITERFIEKESGMENVLAEPEQFIFNEKDPKVPDTSVSCVDKMTNMPTRYINQTQVSDVTVTKELAVPQVQSTDSDEATVTCTAARKEKQEEKCSIVEDARLDIKKEVELAANAFTTLAAEESSALCMDIKLECDARIRDMKCAGELVVADCKSELIEEAFATCIAARQQLYLGCACTSHEDRFGDLVTKQQFYEDLKIELQKDLVHFYEKNQRTMPLSPLIPEVDEDLDKFYVPLKLTQVESREEIHSYNEVFFNADTRLQSIYIQGEAGVGKSTFCTKLVMMWCDILNSKRFGSSSQNNSKISNSRFTDNNTVEDFEFVFFVALRYSCGTECHIDQIIRNQIVCQLPGCRNYDIEFVQTILENEHCLIILDGFDEWSHHGNDNCPPRERTSSIPHRKTWRNCTILTVTRPWKINDARLKDSEMDTLLEITGLTDSEQFTENVLKCLNEKSNKSLEANVFKDDIERVGLSDFLEIPIVAMQLLCLWHDGHELGESRCEIHLNILDMLFNRTRDKEPETLEKVIKHRQPYRIRNSNFCEENKDILLPLSKLAFCTLHSKQKETALVFCEPMVTQHLSMSDLQRVLDIGILSQHQSRSLTSRRATYCFLHKTFQEFLAAYYLATLTGEEEIGEAMAVIFRMYGHNGSDILDISELFVCLSGMNSERSTQISEHIMNVVTAKLSKVCSEKSFYRYDILIIAAQRLMINCTREGIKACLQTIDLALHHMCIHGEFTYHDKLYLERLSNANKGRIMTLLARDCMMDIVKTQELLNHSSYTLSYVDLYNVRSESRSCLDMSACSNIQFLYIKLQSNFDIKINASNLVYCKLFKISKEAQSSILSDLTGAPKLQDISVTECEHMSLLCKVIPTLLMLQSIHIDHTYLAENDIQIPTNVTHIMLNFVTLASKAMYGLLHGMLQAQHEVSCDLSCCTTVPEEDFELIVGNVKRSNKFKVDYHNRNRFQSFTFTKL